MFDIIVITDKGKTTKRVRCMIKQCTIGKSRDNLIQIRGWRIAPVHCRIEMTDKGIYIEDTSEGIGTQVNGEKVQYYGPLRGADIISIGAYEFRIGAVSTDDAEEVVSNYQELPESSDWTVETFFGPAAAAGSGEDGADARPSEEEINRQRTAMWRNRLHQDVLRMMDLRRTDVADMDDEELRNSVEAMIDEVLGAHAAELPDYIDRDRLKREVLNEAIGLGPLEELLADEAVTEIMVNAHDDIFVEREGKLTRSEVTFSSNAAVMSAIERIVTPLGRRIDESSPMVDARLKDGSRVNAIIPPLALKGPTITIRKFSKKKLEDSDLIRFGSINEPMVRLLRTAVEQRCNIIISGGTGSGKTTLLNVLSNFIPHSERVITVEDAAELQLAQPHLVSLESRPPNLEGKGAITIRDLVKNCLRMRPDRIVVGECRGGEALDMLQAMNTGHDGSLTTVHANSPRDVISRLEVMVMMSGMELPVRAIREQVASAVDLIVQQTRFSDGSRRVTHITEVTGVEGDIVQLNDIFLFKQEGFDSEGRLLGHFEATGSVPHFYQDLRERGIPVDMSIFAS
ncbi:ATPase, T2SS/T4P/T4SS family [Thiohalobacter sp.]|uniref:ATPase, T2SS/T4P/T4SS family n=1 Tax=Thiohalobacter sp. TaxID=2025948 RepID=UPI0026240D5D|nr:ATPase, T2SS/T4P/T4SS family [Thiohalobacter sp.]